MIVFVAVAAHAAPLAVVAVDGSVLPPVDAAVDAPRWVVTDGRTRLTTRAVARRIGDDALLRALHQADLTVGIAGAVFVVGGLVPAAFALAHREPLPGERASVPIGLGFVGVGLTVPIVWAAVAGNPRSIDRFYTRATLEPRLTVLP